MQSSSVHALADFAAYMRDHGYGVGIAEQQLMLEAMLRLPVAQYRQIQAAWCAIVCGNKDQWSRYQELFNLFWFPDRVRGSSRMSGSTRRSRSLPEMVQAMHQQMEDANGKLGGAAQLGFFDDSASGAEEGTRNDHASGGASAIDPLTKKDFGEWLQADLQQLNQLAEEVALRVRKRLMRRKHLANKASLINLRATFRKSLKYGGVPIQPAWQRPRKELPNIFILVDVSRSMEMYAQLFLRVARAFCQVADARAFVLHTRLAEITGLLKKRSGRVQEKINAVTFGFGGGTRIATSLQDFIGTYAKNALTARSVVLIFSDGYDTDPADELRLAAERMRAKGAKIFWLHPSERMHFSTALEQAKNSIYGFVPVHNLESLQQLPEVIH
ncbi:MAG: hypothetical protein CVU17_10800 [Betaproteobacteria bacterium HGW-Betaproteobacteria-11]|nr:MAG: hypothetical protein CVU17_10800 [Betaproteobacteria bacterium HGW-Betaproteobacteria-11]